MLIDLQRVLAKALRSEDPLAVLRRESAGLSAEDRAALAHASPDGVQIGAFLVQKLRFERLCRADDRIEEWFDRDPARVTALFRDYNRETPPCTFFPREEAREFRAYLSARGEAVP